MNLVCAEGLFGTIEPDLTTSRVYGTVCKSVPEFGVKLSGSTFISTGESTGGKPDKAATAMVSSTFGCFTSLRVTRTRLWWLN
jgi:hypothetical protein